MPPHVAKDRVQSGGRRRPGGTIQSRYRARTNCEYGRKMRMPSPAVASPSMGIELQRRNIMRGAGKKYDAMVCLQQNG